MKLLWSILFSCLLGYVLLMLGPMVGGILAFGILFGCLFRGLYLLNTLHDKLTKAEIVNKPTRRGSRDLI
ncbi:hypothetical protein H1Q58_12100 [Planococcus maritimus]|uniref:DUF2273 domain-containing protein n=1 Tax=Planococcus maritimus TaxID=192421 RepID=A0A7D7MHT3_PLAMR|nr:hypothetical protein [Planococcus maritimus]OED33078.1 hypothetical protein BHE17_11700 [Planococcus maritimus]QMT16706.1 hypothetical protein H1Q58_12100 [Planococcus maritimus]